METEKALVVFQGRRIRRRWLDDEWWYSVIDVIAILTESADPRNYWKVLKYRLNEEGVNQTVTNCNQLKMPAEDGKMRRTDCGNIEILFRIIQSIPSKKDEPFKQWLAKVGHERIHEIDDPELTMHRMKDTYRAKGYSEEWIEKRSREIAVRNELTDEWDRRNVSRGKEYSILTADMHNCWRCQEEP